eukprot:9171025-Pyramimonas_sp.AAC.1
MPELVLLPELSPTTLSVLCEFSRDDNEILDASGAEDELQRCLAQQTEKIRQQRSSQVSRCPNSITRDAYGYITAWHSNRTHITSSANLKYLRSVFQRGYSQVLEEVRRGVRGYRRLHPEQRDALILFTDASVEMAPNVIASGRAITGMGVEEEVGVPSRGGREGVRNRQLEEM